MPKEQLTIVKVTLERLYAFPKGMDGRTDEQLVKEFFFDYPINSAHATRDFNKVGNSEKLIKAEIVEDEKNDQIQAAKRIQAYIEQRKHYDHPLDHIHGYDGSLGKANLLTSDLITLVNAFNKPSRAKKKTP